MFALDKKVLVKLVNKGVTRKTIAKELGVCATTVGYWMKKFGLKSKFHRTKKRYCRRCGEDDVKKLVLTGRYYCRKCDTQRTIERHRAIKVKSVDYKGGCCSRCGYNKCLAALDFHHRDPKKKDKKFVAMKTRSFEGLREELDKCDLVCKNCHAEIHAGVTI